MKRSFKDEITVLLVDDNTKALNDFSVILKRNGCYVQKATNGFEALHIIEREKFMVAVVTHKMREMGGEEVTLLMREIYSKLELPILMVSDDQSVDAMEKAKDFGINDHAYKKNVNEVVKKIKKLAKIHELVAERLKQKQKSKKKAA